MDWIRSFFGALVLAVVIAFGGLTLATPAFAQQIVVEGNTGVTPASLKPYFTGTDPASVQRGVDDLKATGIYSSVSARAEDGRIVVSLASRQADHQSRRLRGQQQDHKEQLEVEVQSKAGVAYNEALGEADVDRIKDAYKKIRLQRGPGDQAAGATCRTAASISSSPSTRARRPASARSASSATTPSRATACTT